MVLSSPGKSAALRTDSCSAFDRSLVAGLENGPQNLVEISKMRKMNEARRKWEDRHASNSPFRMTYGSSSSIGFDSVEGSPMSTGRGYGLRAMIAKGD